MDLSKIKQFQADGYTVVENFFDADEVRAMQAEVQRFQNDGLIHNVSTDNDGQTHSNTKLNLQLCPMAPHSPLFRALPFDGRVIAAVTSLLGPDVILHLDQVFLKPGLAGVGTSWHQDNAYFKIADPLQGTAMWIAVHDATIANGTIRVMPHAFHDRLEHTRDPGSDHHVRCYPENELDSVALEIPAGSVAFFCYGTPHCTMANNTTSPRAGAAFHFLTYDAVKGSANEAQFGEDRDYKPVLTGPGASGGFNEYGQTVAGTFADEVVKLSAAATA